MSKAGRWAAGWAFVFAVPSFYWALGGTWGASTTVAPELVELARERVPWFVAVLWVTGLLKVFGGVVALALPRGHAWTQFAGWGAAVLLLWHGLLFVVSAPNEWYRFLWGPWFVAGGVAFALAAWTNPGPRRAALLGGAGGLTLSAAMLVAGVG